ncbi:MAG: DUF445 family protein [Lachnospiraceae bacterium]|nr:DUF445 family protein [Lachnospiraceae bacterium]
MHYLEILSGPLIGGIIGYCTNFIAVKMLFRPLKPIKIGSFPLPFTPGIIPKRKDSLAKAVGAAVGNNLLTKEDIQKLFSEEKIRNTIIQGILDKLEKAMDSSIEEVIAKFASQESIDRKKADLTDLLTVKIKLGILSMDLGALIAEGGSSILKEKFQGGMFSFLLNDDFIASIAEPIGREVEKYIDSHGEEIFQPLVKQQMDEVLAMNTGEAFTMLGLAADKIRSGMESAYDALVNENIDKLLAHFDIVAIVQQKIEEMDVRELEQLVLSVMKKELDVIVNLGALIGFIIGFLNIL